MVENSGESFRVLGLDIKFPFKPYGIQKAMMNKVAVTLTNKEHSLIESPTGTGKTLVLLCASLAWQKKSKLISQPFLSDRLRKIRAEERREKLLKKPCTCGRRPSRSELDELKEAKDSCKKGKQDIECSKVDLSPSNYYESLNKRQKTDDYEKESLESSPYFKKPKEPECITIDENDERTAKSFSNGDHLKGNSEGVDSDEECKIIDPESTKHSKADQVDGLIFSKGQSDNSKPLCRSCSALEADGALSEVLGESTIDSSIKIKVPRIYYGTRTHKQITQVIRELNKTEYKKNLRMCILSSRERTCINDSVKNESSRNDKCQELIKNKQAQSNTKSKSKLDICPFYQDTNTIAAEFEMINLDYEDTAWDIENANEWGNSKALCPYYGLRSLQAQADITFCPYNYLLDTNIRNAMNINLSNSIIIIDEAHNIEDICRESASFVVDTTQLEIFLETINLAARNFIQGSVIADAYQYFKDKLSFLLRYMQQFEFEPSEQFKSGDFLAKRIMSQQEMLSQLQILGFGHENLSEMNKNLKILHGDDEESDKSSSKSGDNQQNLLSYSQTQILTQLCLTLTYIYSNDRKYAADYRAVVTKNLEREVARFNPRSPNPVTNGDRHVWRLSLHCMNPGIAFEKIHSSAWSVIVASGTLSPIESLKLELGCKFSHVFEGSHVIGGDRMFASVISHGPSRVDLNCAFSNSLTLAFQDEVGAVVRDICGAVPNGILCFFPSYDRLENLYNRWKDKKLVKGTRMGEKKIYFEKKNTTTAKFEEDLRGYHRAAQTREGALLLAVYRGKVSEGIDFADAAARAVITIGIPYPNIKEVTVGLKRDYNDIARRSKPNLMTGSDWYASQAFRALNQAVGRCIRHKDDWGAVIMIDSRLKQVNSINKISRWLRQCLFQSNDYQHIHDCLQEFVTTRLNEDSAR